METILMNTESSKTNEAHRLSLSKINLILKTQTKILH